MSDLVNVLILGRHPSLSKHVLEILAEAGITGKSSNTVEGAIDLARSEHFDVLLLGGAVTLEEERLAVAGVKEVLPEIKVKRRDLYSNDGPVEHVRAALAGT